MMAPGAILGLKSSLDLGLPDNLKNKFPELLFKGRPNYVFKKGIANYLKGLYNTYRFEGEFTTVPEQGASLLDTNKKPKSSLFSGKNIVPFF